MEPLRRNGDNRVIGFGEEPVRAVASLGVNDDGSPGMPSHSMKPASVTR
jgi:hypothetical protein